MRDDLGQRLADWVDTSGRALELRTVRLFGQHPSNKQLNQSWPYEDPTTKQEREGDVLAVLGYVNAENLAVSIDLAIECKAAKDHPWVAFYDDWRMNTELSRLWVLDAGDWGGELAPLIEHLRTSGATATDRVATHAVSALGKDGKNFARDATLQAMSFARSRAELVRYTTDPKDATLAKAVLPIVVTQAPLFTCELSPDGDVLLEPVDRLDVWVQTPREGRRRLFVRTEESLKRLAGELDLFCVSHGVSTEGADPLSSRPA